MAYERACGWHIEDYWKSVEGGQYVYVHGGNGTGKSRGGGAFDLAKCIGLDHLTMRDGTTVPLAVLKPPVHWAIGVQSYKLADPGPLQALRDLLGRHEYSENKTDHTFRIRHLRARDESEWSTLYVYPYDGPRPEGPRLDGFRCDEPPPISHLDALLTRFKRGRRLYKSITGTPIRRAEWWPILQQFPGGVGQTVDGRRRIQAALWDNETISREQCEAVLRDMKWGQTGMRKIVRARVLGEHVDDSGSNPWDEMILDRWLARCRAPRLEPVVVQREQEREGGRRLVPIEATVRVYHDPVPGDVCYVFSDHGKGIQDGRHDPDAIHVYSARHRRLCAVVSEYLGGWGNGLASVLLARRYDAQWFPLVTGGYAESALSAARSEGFYRVGHARTNTRPGDERVQLGLTETKEFRNAAIGGIEQAMKTDSVLVEDEEVVRCLMGCVIDANGKIVGGPETGWHDEHLVCLGAACHELGNRPVPKEPAKPAAERSASDIASDLFAARIMAARTPQSRNGKAVPNL